MKGVSGPDREFWQDLCLNDTIMAQTQAMGHHQNQFDVPHWAREMCNRAQEAEVRMVSGESVFQAAQLFYLDNRQVLDHLEGGMDSFHNQWSKVMDL